MPKRIRKFSPGKLNSQQVAESWLKIGIQPVPILKRTQKPRGGKGWNKLLVTKDTIGQFFSSGDNVGGLWGEPSGWIVDVDLDCDEATAVAPYYLPPTFVYGRHSRPSTHYLYRCEGIATTKWQDEEKSMIVEIRSTGSQSVLPPSIHPDDERYEINHDIPFKAIGRRELERLVGWIAAASLLVRNYPNEGGRHDFVHAVTGTLLWSNWNEKLVRKFMEGFFQGIHKKEDDIDQRVRTMENTIENYQQGNRIQGWRTLSQWFSGKTIELLKRWLTRGLDQNEVPLKVKLVDDKRDPTLDFDFANVRIPGLVGDIAEWSSKMSYLKQPMFDIAMGLMCTALASTNKYLVDGWDTALQPYFMLLAPTAGGKDSALDGVYRFAKHVGLGDYVFQGFQSYHSMLDRLGAAPNIACWLWDEAARKLRSSGRSSASPEYQVMTWLLSLYGKANSHSPGVPGRHQAIASIDHPFLTVMATAQPQQLMEALTDTDISTGLINRFVLFDVGDILPDPNLERATIFPARIEDQVKKIKSVELPGGHRPFVGIKVENMHTYAKFRDFDNESRLHAFNGGGGEMWGRSNQNALVIAGIVAVGINPRRPMITEDIADWALSLTRWSSTRWTIRVDESGSRSQIEKRSKNVEKYIREAERFQHRARTNKMSNLLRRGLMPRSLLTQLTRHVTLRDLDDVLNHLVIADLIATGEVDGTEVFWPKIV